ncbi:MAG: type II secretion system F family protein [Bacillota bacterium]
MSTLVLVLIFAATAITTLLLVAPTGDSAIIKQRAASIRRSGASRTEKRRVVDEEMALPFTQRVLAPMFEAVARVIKSRTPSRVQEALQLKLAQAGNPFTATRFLGMQFTGASLGGLLGLIAVSGAIGTKPLIALMMVGVFVVIGWRVPDFMLSRMIATRREKMDKALPDVLDLLSVSVEAGLGLDGAIQKVGEKFPEPTSGEFRELLKSIRLGTPRADALRSLADRSGVPDMRTFTAAIIQAEQLGVSISRVLKAQSEALRVKRKQKIEEKAMALPIKMLFPLILFIFPTIFIVVLGPVLIQIMETMTKRP